MTKSAEPSEPGAPESRGGVCEPYGLADNPGHGSGDSADKKSRQVRLLPHDEVVPEDDGDLRVEPHVVTLAGAETLLG